MHFVISNTTEVRSQSSKFTFFYVDGNYSYIIVCETYIYSWSASRRPLQN